MITTPSLTQRLSLPMTILLGTVPPVDGKEIVLKTTATQRHPKRSRGGNAGRLTGWLRSHLPGSHISDSH